MAGARAAWGIEGLWGSNQDQARETLLQELFPDVGQTYVDWDLTSGNAFEAFMFKRQEMLPNERPSLWRTNGSWEVTSDRETPSLGMIHMAHYGSLPPIWEFLDKPSNESLPLLSLEEFTDIVNGCSPDALRRNAFAIFRIVVMAQEVHEALQDAHNEMGLAKITPERPTDEVGNQSAADRPGLTEQDAASAARQQEALASAAAHAERASTATPSYEDNSLKLKHT